MAKILIIDDEPAVREFLSTLLSCQGHQTVEAADADEGLALFHHECPQLIIADIAMPERDGFEFLRQLRADPSGMTTPVIVHTALFLDQKVRDLARACGVQHVLEKPSSPATILANVEACLSSMPPKVELPVEFELNHFRLVVGQLARKVRELKDEIAHRKRLEETLRKSEERYRSLAEATSQIVWRTDADGNVLEVSPAFERYTGLPVDRAHEWNWFEVVHPDDRKLAVAAWKNAVAERRPYEVEYRVRIGDGGYRYFQVRGVPILGSDGEIVEWIGTGNDVTARKKVEGTLLSTQARLSGIIVSAMDAIITIDPDERIVIFNAAAESLFQCPAALAIGQPLNEFIPERLRAAHSAHIQNFMQTGVTNRRMNELRPVTGRRKDGSEFPIEASISQIEVNDRKLMTVILRDITQRLLAENKIRHQAERLQQATSRIIEIQETERRHLARELHDEIGQVLSAISVNLKLLRTKVPSSTWPRLDESIQLVDVAVQQVRDLSLDLRPAVLDDFGLKAGLNWYVRRFSERAGLKVHLVDKSFPTDLPVALRNACFRVAQEALTNIGRHAGAKNVWVELAEQESELRLSIRDDGKGFDVAAARHRATQGHSLGLLGMQERIELLGGTVEIASQPGCGATVSVRLPVAVLEPAAEGKS